MEILIVKTRSDLIYYELITIWENSVKATHTFLTNDEIAKIKLYVPEALKNVQNLAIATIENKPVAFMGIQNKRIEMLFVSPDNRGQGIGRKLIDFAKKNFSADEVTVNEQNIQAVGFYTHLGFKVYKRTDLDEQGNAYPLLYMKL